jgi:hypothetical protein
MDTPNSNDTIGNSRGNSISSGDPKLDDNQTVTSTDPTSSKNTGESAPQQGVDIVNEQEQHKTVNMEEYIENSSENRLGENEGTKVREDGNGIIEDTDDQSSLPDMNSGAL